jgi:predicted DCC family thiol-disulfide oxidoreductase YuxK
MRQLTVLYDPDCGLCARLAAWLIRQEQLIQLRVVPKTQAGRVHPALAPTGNELVVVSDEGGLYLGDHAWLVCLHALKHYRDLAARLSHPALRTLASRAFKVLSANRHTISTWLEGLTDAEMRAELSRIHAPNCHGTKR